MHSAKELAELADIDVEVVDAFEAIDRIATGDREDVSSDGNKENQDEET